MVTFHFSEKFLCRAALFTRRRDWPIILFRGQPKTQSNAEKLTVPTSIADHPLQVSLANDHLVIRWPDGTSSRFHNIWLRDNCMHPSRWNNLTGERSAITEQIPEDLGVGAVTLEGDDTVAIAWDDGGAHSRFSGKWLWRHRYDGAAPQPLAPAVVPWKAEYGGELQTFQHDELLADPHLLCRMLRAFASYGLVRICGVPTEDKAVERFANRLAYVREIAFDRVADIRVSPDPYNLGFTDAALSLHTDCSSYAWPPDAMLFHCLSNDVNGGECLFSDGVQAIRTLRQSNLHALEILCRIKICHRLYSRSVDTQHLAPRVILDQSGSLAVLRYSNWTPQPLRPSSFEDVPAFYRAHRCLAEIVNSPENMIEIRPVPGDLLLINNHRVLHGRRAFDPKTGLRHFQQVYMELDDRMSLLRITERGFR